MATSPTSHAYGGDVRIRGARGDRSRVAMVLFKQSPRSHREHARQLSRVALSDERKRARAPLAVNVVEIGAREPSPTRLKLDAHDAAPKVACLDQRRADPAHGVDNEVAGLAVAFDRSPGERREHLSGMPI